MLQPLILLPGMPCDRELWRGQIEGLADVAAALVGDLSLDNSVQAMARRVLAMAPGRFALAGLSMGGYVAFEIMRQAPERVDRLALFDTAASPDTPEKIEGRRRAMATASEGGYSQVISDMLPKMVHADAVESVGPTFKAMAHRVGADAYIRQQEAIIGRPDSRPLLPAISVPTLVAVGDSDALTPPEVAREMADTIEGARLHIFERCGHLSTMERPQEATHLMREWLAA